MAVQRPSVLAEEAAERVGPPGPLLFVALHVGEGEAMEALQEAIVALCAQLTDLDLK